MCITGHHVLQDAAVMNYILLQFLFMHALEGKRRFCLFSVAQFLNFEKLVVLNGNRTDILSTPSKKLQLVLGA